ncbi:MAG: peptidylprolyl isomerase [Lamprocystis purpurea]|jgi:peptidyl-prolyl cis-trans isomerase C|uniref:peptidylprolyl isomerase n=1 Tax=Lamprocystis purpurea TaxID=61598 RepID=UPI00037FAD36|nr:peptidylprolyl isomerase [Lamprocystis purpurea]MBV5276236.1 peptidylprolyl isomerase [Lamprocystis purpurea]
MTVGTSLAADPRRRPLPLIAGLGCCLLPFAITAAADAVLIRGPDPGTGAAVIVTSADVRAEITAAPEPLRTRMTTDRAMLIETINNVYRRKALVGAAKAGGLDQLPAVQAQIERARDQTLAIALLDSHQQALMTQIPDMLARAQEVYQAQPDRYLIPEQVQVRHILLRAGTDEKRAARRAEAEALLQRLREGADFATLAKQSSDDRSAVEGGALPPFKRGQMVPPFEAAAFALKQPGDLSPIVTSEFGLHLIRLESIQPEQQRTFDQVKDAIIAKLQSDWLADAQETWRLGIVDPSKSQVDHPALESFLVDTTGGQPSPDATPRQDAHKGP